MPSGMGTETQGFHTWSLKLAKLGGPGMEEADITQNNGLGSVSISSVAPIGLSCGDGISV